MICPNCKSSIDNHVKFCNYCGEKLTNNNHDSQYDYSKNYSKVTSTYDKEHQEQYEYSKNYSDSKKDYDEDHENQYSYSEMYSNIHKSVATSDEDYIKKFIGSEYEEVEKKQFSIKALVGGTFYLLYKKMIMQGILVLTVLLALYYYYSELALLCTIITHIFLAWKFNEIYENFARKRVDEIKISNPDKSSTELLDLCEKEGTTKGLIGWILVIIFLIIIGGIYHFSTLEKEEEKIERKEETYQMENLTYTIPKDFTIGEYGSDTYKYYSYVDKENLCSVSISTSTTNYYKTIDSYLEKYIYEDERAEIKIEEEQINSFLWKNKKISLNSYTEDNYVTIVQDKIYHIRYHNEGSYCEKQKEAFLSSLQWNEQEKNN